MTKYLMEPEKRKDYEEATEKARDECIKKEDKKQMTREEVLKATELLEKFKFNAQIKMYQIVRTRQMPPA